MVNKTKHKSAPNEDVQIYQRKSSEHVTIFLEVTRNRNVWYPHCSLLFSVGNNLLIHYIKHGKAKTSLQLPFCVFRSAFKDFKYTSVKCYSQRQKCTVFL